MDFPYIMDKCDRSKLTRIYSRSQAGSIQCDICNKSFRDNYILKAHRRIHTGCQKRYTFLLRSCSEHPNHMLVRDGQEQISCPKHASDAEIKWLKEHAKNKNKSFKREICSSSQGTELQTETSPSSSSQIPSYGSCTEISRDSSNNINQENTLPLIDIPLNISPLKLNINIFNQENEMQRNAGGLNLPFNFSENNHFNEENALLSTTQLINFLCSDTGESNILIPEDAVQGNSQQLGHFHSNFRESNYFVQENDLQTNSQQLNHFYYNSGESNPWIPGLALQENSQQLNISHSNTGESNYFLNENTLRTYREHLNYYHYNSEESNLIQENAVQDNNYYHYNSEESNNLIQENAVQDNNYYHSNSEESNNLIQENAVQDNIQQLNYFLSNSTGSYHFMQ